MSDGHQIQQQAQALGDPSRYEIFEHIASADHPLGVADLTELMGFNHNAIRQHLAKLLDADLITEATEKRTTRGRPRLTYQARDDAFDQFQNRPDGSYQRLAGLLLEVITTGDPPREVGRSHASLTANGDPTDSVATLARQLQVDGFDPSVEGSQIKLTRCPFASLATTEPSIICEIHRGILDGYCEQLPEPTNATLTPKPPKRAGCIVDVHSPD